MRKAFGMLLAVLIVTAFMAVPARAAETYRWGGGATGGGWFVAISAGAKLLSQELKGRYVFTNVPSPSVASNMRRLQSGEFDTTWVDFYTLYHAWHGSDMFKEDGRIRNFRIVANVRKHINIYVVLDDSPIKTLSDIKGKKVSVTMPGMGSHVICKQSLSALGLWNQIQKKNLGFGASARALGDRQIDVFCSSGGPTLPVVIQLSHQKKIRFLSMTKKEQQLIVSKNKMYSAARTPGFKRLKGMEKPFNTISYNALWVVNKRMSNDAVYQMVKTTATPKNLEKLVKVIRYWSRLSGRLQFLKNYGMYVHPAAARYWKERGVNLPPEIVKAF